MFCCLFAISAIWKARRRANLRMGEKALRVLGVAYKHIDALPQRAHLRKAGMRPELLGLLGMIDPPREEAEEAVAICLGRASAPL